MRIIFLLLAVLSHLLTGQVFAESPNHQWTKLLTAGPDAGADAGVTFYLDQSSITDGLPVREFLLLMDYPSTISVDNAEVHSVILKSQLNCKDLSVRVTTIVMMSGKMGQGRQQFTQDGDTWRPLPKDFHMVPGLVCHNDQKKTRKPDTAKSARIRLQVSHTQPDQYGDFSISINTNADTASLKINGEELGGRKDGKYLINRVARAGQSTQITILASDVNGNTDTQTITVNRKVVESKISYAALNPSKIKRQAERDAVAIIIGIADYRSLPKAEFANDDARAFYDYAIRALGIKPENLKLLVDTDAEEIEILKAFRTWLPSRVKSTTDVYVFYSGHGLPSQDGQGIYLLPQRADSDLVEDTAIPMTKINSALQAVKPKSVTIFMDACYSGLTRSGAALVANARPVAIKSDKKLFPDNFTVITASQADQISSSSPDLRHGIFSYYLMKGMEGDADANKDGKITLGEIESYLAENVGRQAGMMSRRQEPQVVGDTTRVLIGR